MSQFQLQILLMGLGILGTAGLLLWSVTSIRYQITPRYLRVTWLGVPVRWIRLADIKHIGNKPVAWAERWPNVLFDSRRTLVLRRRRGLFRSFLITPKYPFEFKMTLEQARNTVLAESLGPHLGSPLPGNTVPPSPPSRAKDAA